MKGWKPVVPDVVLDVSILDTPAEEQQEWEALCELAGIPAEQDPTQYAFTDPRYFQAKDSNLRREAGLAALLRTRDPEEARRAMSQLVPTMDKARTHPQGGASSTRDIYNQRLRSKQDVYRAHLRNQLNTERRRFVRGVGPEPHAPWVADPELLYEYAGMPPESAMGSVYKFVRVDLARAFEPGNVQWMTDDQIRARMHTRVVEYEGEVINLPELAKRTGLKLQTLRSRYDAGVRGPRLWDGRNLSSRLTIEINGEAVPVARAARMWGITPTLLRSRLARGMTGEALFDKRDMRRKENRGRKGEDDE